MRHRRPNNKIKNSEAEHTVFLSNREAYMKAKAFAGFKRKDVNNWPGYCKIINTFYEHISNAIIDNPEGVFIKGLGYFGVLLYKKNSIGARHNNGREVEDLINAHSNGHIFSLNFTAISTNADLRTFTMDGTFSHSLYKRLSKNLINRKFYRNNLTLFLK